MLFLKARAVAVVIVMFLALSFASAAAQKARSNKLTPQKPEYEIRLGAREFSLLHGSLIAGLNEYGGSIEFDLRMGKEQVGLVWTVTVRNTRLLEMLAHHVAEESSELIKTLDPDSLDEQSRATWNAMRSLVRKVDFAQENPIWTAVKVIGRLTAEGENLFLTGEAGRYEIIGEKLNEIHEFIGGDVVMNGVVRPGDRIEAVGCVEWKKNTLELFVMSLCPFARMAEAKLFDFLEDPMGGPEVKLEVRYIFYARNDGDTTIFTALHGDEEVTENLVQMVLRDEYPRYFVKYLTLRANGNDEPWAQVAEEAGLSGSNIEAVRTVVESSAQDLIKAEYDYVTGFHWIRDGSPTYVWEGRRVASIWEIEPFDRIDLSSDQCAGP
jgi:hypothetical protein